MKQIGKKGRQWIKDKKKLVEELKGGGIYKVEGMIVSGPCKDCKHWHYNLHPHHDKFKSQGGSNKKENIVWICNEFPCLCHDKRHGKIKEMNKKNKKSKISWMGEHKCKHCKFIIRSLICSNCGKLSI